jgi:hypothetical protein
VVFAKKKKADEQPKDRRRTERKSVGWAGRYALEGSSDWYECTVENVSQRGAGLLLRGDTAVALGQRLVIELDRIGTTPVSLRIRGIARTVGVAFTGVGVDIGVELAVDAPHERAALRLFPT